MTDHETIATYDKSAEALAAYFAGNASRADMIDEGLRLANATDGARVVEVGCGDGRDAVDIISRVGWYEGVDPASGAIELARKRLPDANFVCADALSYEYPSDLDAIYGFATYLHLDKDDFARATSKAAQALRTGGVLLMTLKEGDGYQEKLVEDEFGMRMFYLYDEATVRSLIDPALEVVRIEKQTLQRKTANWLLVILRKK